MIAPKLRFAGFNSPWEKQPLGKVFDITSGSTPSRGKIEYFIDGDIPWVKTTDLNNSLIISTQEKVTGIAIRETSSLKILPRDTVFVAMYGGFNQIGRTGLLINEAACNQALSAVKPNKGKVVPYFLLLYLNFKVEDWKLIAASSRKDPNITKKDVEKFQFIYPSINEQTKISDFLSSVDEKITLMNKQYDLLCQYKKGMMQKIFSQEIRFMDENGEEYPDWELKLISDIAIVNPKSKTLPTEFIYIDLESVEKGILKKENLIYKDNAPSRAQRLLQLGDVLFQLVRPYQNNNYLFLLSGNYVASTGYAQLRAKYCSKFLYQLLHLESFISEVMNRCTGTSYPAINSSDLASIEVGVPCELEQIKIANFLCAIDEKIATKKIERDKLKTWKQGLLQQMFV
ncbi:EcoKI restriction-modification system protein HsdS [Serratia quinivorans]|uniref:restriction endonuclease subunit S n=1 Tax=Serratia quinivorans TaxID=137545 RepID=UPI0021783393|nr:restriction endonuclease subunit S [Serratia quinivorans]CAI1686099.1 EcoKI restriction-modification system protein HsdS [Serratia quinivorans]